MKNRVLSPASQHLCIAATTPSNKSLVALDTLSLQTTTSKLQKAVSTIDTIRKCEVQPGCTLHVVDEAGAIFAAEQVSRGLGCKTTVRNSCLPSLVLKNLPGNVSASVIQESFQCYDPKVIRFSGKRSISVTVREVTQAVNALTLARTLSVNGHKINGHIATVPDGRFCVQISDLPTDTKLSSILDDLTRVIQAEIPSATLTATTGTASVVVRLDAEKMSPKLAKEALSRVSFGSVAAITANIKTKPRPALVIRNVAQVGEDTLRTFCMEELNADRVQRTWRSKDMFGDLAFVYFSSEADAFVAIRKFHETHLGPHKIKASYREMVEPAVKIRGLAKSMTPLTIQQTFSQFNIHRVSVVSDSEDNIDSSTLQAIIVVSDPKEARLLVETVNLRKFDGVQYSAEECNIEDTCMEFTFCESEVPTNAELEKALSNAALSYRSVYSSSDIQAYIAFDSIDRATKSMGKFTRGEIQLKGVNTGYESDSGGGVMSSLSVYPSYIVEVNGLSPNESAQSVLEIATKDDKVQVFKAARSGIVKFKRHAFVVPGMRRLRAVTVDSVNLKPRRFHEVENDGETAYDIEKRDVKIFDRNHLKLLMKDYLTAEPAIRYQIAKNYFERALFTAQGQQEIGYILADEAPNEIKSEVKMLLKEKNKLDEMTKRYENDESDVRVPKELKEKMDKNTNRLFEIFIQREDMLQFSSDFHDIEAALGPSNTDDIYEWNKFMSNDDDSLQALAEDLRFYSGSSKSDRKDAAREKRIADAKEKRRVRKEGIVQDHENINIMSSEMKCGELPDPTKPDCDSELDFSVNQTEKESYDEFDASRLMDYDGHLWSGVIVHQDTTQKVVPGERIISYRCLVTIGNRRGAGGFGMGKGADADIALRNAFRDALRNLVYLDLYENAALAHDLRGKHNDCIVYIRATPKARDMVASPLARSIFNSLGIVSCSAKIVGNRHPYSMVRAIFNALSKHKNIDEIAKERGTRYLTLKWMYDRGL